MESANGILDFAKGQRLSGWLLLTAFICLNTLAAVMLYGCEPDRLSVEPVELLMESAGIEQPEERRLALINSGAAPLKIVGMSASCGVAISHAIPMTLAGGQEKSIAVLVMPCPRSSGRDSRYLRFYTDSGSITNIRIKMK